jgi:hypothetical protein
MAKQQRQDQICTANHLAKLAKPPESRAAACRLSKMYSQTAMFAV